MILNLHLLVACKLAERIQNCCFHVRRAVEGIVLSARRCNNTREWNLARDRRNCSLGGGFIRHRDGISSFLCWFWWRIGLFISSIRSDLQLVRDCLAWLLRFAVWTCDLRRYNGGIDRSSRYGGLTSRGSSGRWRVFVLLIGLQRRVLCSIPAHATISARLLACLSMIFIQRLTSLLHPVRFRQRSNFVPPSCERS